MKKTVAAGLVLAALMASAGEVKFAKTAVTVKEDAAYAELTVKRTGVDLTRVRFATVADTAVPGGEYYATNGILTWAQGDRKDQKIRVRLMPDLVAKWEPEKSRGVRLEALDGARVHARAPGRRGGKRRLRIEHPRFVDDVEVVGVQVTGVNRLEVRPVGEHAQEPEPVFGQRPEVRVNGRRVPFAPHLRRRMARPVVRAKDDLAGRQEALRRRRRFVR